MKTIKEFINNRWEKFINLLIIVVKESQTYQLLKKDLEIILTIVEKNDKSIDYCLKRFTNLFAATGERFRNNINNY